MEATRKAGKGKNTVTPFKGCFYFGVKGRVGSIDMKLILNIDRCLCPFEDGKWVNDAGNVRIFLEVFPVSSLLC